MTWKVTGCREEKSMTSDLWGALPIREQGVEEKSAKEVNQLRSEQGGEKKIEIDTQMIHKICQ